MNHTRIVRLALAALVTTGLTLAVPACSNDDSGDEGRPSSTSKVTTGSAAATALAGVVDDVVAPGYDALVGSLTAWTFEIGQLCAEPGTERLEEARDGWRASVRAYESTVAHDIGPAMDQRLMSDLAFAPRVASIDKLLAGDDPVDAATMADRGANVRGLYSAEHALFGDGSEQLATAAGARRCEYLSSVATLAEVLKLAKRFTPAVAAYWQRLQQRAVFHSALRVQAQAAKEQGVGAGPAIGPA